MTGFKLQFSDCRSDCSTTCATMLPENVIGFFKKMGQTGLFFCLFSFFSHDKYSTNNINEKAQMACMGLEPRAAGWQAQTIPLSYVIVKFREHYPARHGIKHWFKVKEGAKTSLMMFTFISCLEISSFCIIRST